MTNTIEEAVCTEAHFSPDFKSGYGWIENGDGERLFVSSTALFTNRGVIDAIEVGDLVSYQKFEKPKPGRSTPSCRRVWLRKKAQQAAAHDKGPGFSREELITTLAGESETEWFDKKGH